MIRPAGNRLAPPSTAEKSQTTIYYAESSEASAMYCSNAQSNSALNERRWSFAKERMASITRSGKMIVTFFFGPFSCMLVLYRIKTSMSRVFAI